MNMTNRRNAKSSMWCNVQLVMAILLTLSGIDLLFCGFWVDQEGEISSGVLVAFGETSTFAGALFGVDDSYRVKRDKMNE